MSGLVVDWLILRCWLVFWIQCPCLFESRCCVLYVSVMSTRLRSPSLMSLASEPCRAYFDIIFVCACCVRSQKSAAAKEAKGDLFLRELFEYAVEEFHKVIRVFLDCH